MNSAANSDTLQATPYNLMLHFMAYVSTERKLNQNVCFCVFVMMDAGTSE